MPILFYAATLLTITATFAYFNHYTLKLPRNTGLLVIALVVSVGMRVAEYLIPDFGAVRWMRGELEKADLGPLLLNVVLGFLLFAGAVEVDVRGLMARKWTILVLATIGVLLSTLIIGGGLYYILQWVGIAVPLPYCLAFGALISPTDPVTVLDALSRIGVPKRLQAIIAGESLFNDGVGVVLFTIFLAAGGVGSGEEITVLSAVTDFLREAGGGVLLGLGTGAIAFFAMRGIDEYGTELMITLALVCGTYAIAQYVGVSGPVAVVVNGLMFGSIGKKYATSSLTQDYIQKFWSLIDELLNAMLFLLIGLEFAVIDLRTPIVVAAALAVPLALFARVTSIVLASLPLHLGAKDKGAATILLTWSGLRGGISVALALSLPASEYRSVLLTCCYGIVIFTMVVQGLTLRPLAHRLYPEADQSD